MIICKIRFEEIRTLGVSSKSQYQQQEPRAIPLEKVFFTFQEHQGLFGIFGIIKI
jgi:hypothetical protein